MTESLFLSPRYLPASPADSPTRKPAALLERPPTRLSFTRANRTLPLLPSEDWMSQALMLGLVAVTLPAAAYSLFQAWSLVGTETLNHAVRAFLP